MTSQKETVGTQNTTVSQVAERVESIWGTLAGNQVAEEVPSLTGHIERMHTNCFNTINT